MQGGPPGQDAAAALAAVDLGLGATDTLLEEFLNSAADDDREEGSPGTGPTAAEVASPAAEDAAGEPPSDGVLTVQAADTLLRPGVPPSVPLSSLTVVDLSQCGLRELRTAALRAMPTLECLLLVGNELTSLDAVFDVGLQQLWMVDAGLNLTLAALPLSLPRHFLGLLRIDHTSIGADALDILAECCCIELSAAGSPLAECGAEEVLRRCPHVVSCNGEVRTGPQAAANLDRMGLPRANARAQRTVDHLLRGQEGAADGLLGRERARFLAQHFTHSFCQLQSCPSQWMFPRDPEVGMPFRATRRTFDQALAYVNERLLPMAGIKWRANAADGAPLFVGFWRACPDAVPHLVTALLAAVHFPSLPAGTLHVLLVQAVAHFANTTPFELPAPPEDALSTNPTEILAGCWACLPRSALRVLLELLSAHFPAVGDALRRASDLQRSDPDKLRRQVAYQLSRELLGPSGLGLVDVATGDLKHGGTLGEELIAAAREHAERLAAKQEAETVRLRTHGDSVKQWLDSRCFAHELMWRNERHYSTPGTRSLALGKLPAALIDTGPAGGKAIVSVIDTGHNLTSATSNESTELKQQHRRHRLSPFLLTEELRRGAAPPSGSPEASPEPAPTAPSETTPTGTLVVSPPPSPAKSAATAAAEEAPPGSCLNLVPVMRKGTVRRAPPGSGKRRRVIGDGVILSEVSAAVKRRQTIMALPRRHLLLRSEGLRRRAECDGDEDCPVVGVSAPRGACRASVGAAVRAQPVIAPPGGVSAVPLAAAPLPAAARVALRGEPVDIVGGTTGSWQGWVADVDAAGQSVSISEEPPGGSSAAPPRDKRDAWGRLAVAETPPKGLAGYRTPNPRQPPRPEPCTLAARGPQRHAAPRRRPAELTCCSDEAPSEWRPRTPRRLVVASSMLRWQRGGWLLACPTAPSLGEPVRVPGFGTLGLAWISGVDAKEGLATLCSSPDPHDKTAERVWVDSQQLQWDPGSHGQGWQLRTCTPAIGDLVVHPQGEEYGKGWVREVSTERQLAWVGAAPAKQHGAPDAAQDDGGAEAQELLPVEFAKLRWRRGAWVIMTANAPPPRTKDAVAGGWLPTRKGSILSSPPVAPPTVPPSPAGPRSPPRTGRAAATPEAAQSPQCRSPAPTPARAGSPTRSPPRAGAAAAAGIEAKGTGRPLAHATLSPKAASSAVSCASIADHLAASGTLTAPPRTQWTGVGRDTAGRRPVVVKDPQGPPWHPFTEDALRRMAVSRRRQEERAEARRSVRPPDAPLRPLDCSGSLAGARQGYSQGQGQVFLPTTFRTQLAESKRAAAGIQRPASAMPPPAPRSPDGAHAAAGAPAAGGRPPQLLSQGAGGPPAGGATPPRRRVEPRAASAPPRPAGNTGPPVAGPSKDTAPPAPSAAHQPQLEAADEGGCVMVVDYVPPGSAAMRRGVGRPGSSGSQAALPSEHWPPHATAEPVYRPRAVPRAAEPRPASAPVSVVSDAQRALFRRMAAALELGEKTAGVCEVPMLEAKLALKAQKAHRAMRFLRGW